MKTTITYEFEDGDERTKTAASAFEMFNDLYDAYYSMRAYRKHGDDVTDEEYERIAEWMDILNRTIRL